MHVFDEQPDFLHAVAWSADGAWIATGCDTGRITLIDAAKRKPIRRCRHEAKRTRQRIVWSLDFTPDGRTLFAGTGDSLIRAWDPASGKERYTIRGHKGRVLATRVSPDGRLLASGADDGKVGIWDAASGRKRYLLGGHGKCVYAVAWHPTQPVLASGAADGTVRLWDTRTWSVIQRIDVTKDIVYGLAWNSAGTRLAASCGSGGLFVFAADKTARAK